MTLRELTHAVFPFLSVSVVQVARYGKRGYFISVFSMTQWFSYPAALRVALNG